MIPGNELRISPEPLHLLLVYPWPGNLRQLRNVTRTAIALREGDLIIDSFDINLSPIYGHSNCPSRASCIGTEISAVEPDGLSAENPLASAEYKVILKSLEAHD